MSGGGAEREGDTQSEAGCRLQAVSTRAPLGAQTHERRDRDQRGTSDTQPTEPPRHPNEILVLNPVVPLHTWVSTPELLQDLAFLPPGEKMSFLFEQAQRSRWDLAGL